MSTAALPARSRATLGPALAWLGLAAAGFLLWFVLDARLARDLPATREDCPAGSHRALDGAIMTAPSHRDAGLLAKLDAVAGRVLNG